jgi:hypothetical protein
MSLAGIPRIASGLDLVKRFEPSALLNGLISGDRAHRILLELARRISQDRPSDTEAAFNRLHDLNTYLNNTTSEGVEPLEPQELAAAFRGAAQLLEDTQPWTPVTRFPGFNRPQRSR